MDSPLGWSAILDECSKNMEALRNQEKHRNSPLRCYMGYGIMMRMNADFPQRYHHDIEAPLAGGLFKIMFFRSCTITLGVSSIWKVSKRHSAEWHRRQSGPAGGHQTDGAKVLGRSIQKSFAPMKKYLFPACHRYLGKLLIIFWIPEKDSTDWFLAKRHIPRTCRQSDRSFRHRYKGRGKADMSEDRVAAKWPSHEAYELAKNRLPDRVRRPGRKQGCCWPQRPPINQPALFTGFQVTFQVVPPNLIG